MTMSHMPCPQPLIDRGNSCYDCEQTRETKAIDHRERQADPSAPLRSHSRQLAPQYIPDRKCIARMSSQALASGVIVVSKHHSPTYNWGCSSGFHYYKYAYTVTQSLNYQQISNCYLTLIRLHTTMHPMHPNYNVICHVITTCVCVCVCVCLWQLQQS